jgi:hypothetical protein
MWRDWALRVEFWVLLTGVVVAMVVSLTGGWR